MARTQSPSSHITLCFKSGQERQTVPHVAGVRYWGSSAGAAVVLCLCPAGMQNICKFHIAGTANRLNGLMLWSISHGVWRISPHPDHSVGSLLPVLSPHSSLKETPFLVASSPLFHPCSSCILSGLSQMRAEGAPWNPHQDTSLSGKEQLS